MEYTTEFDLTGEVCTVRVTGRHKRPQDSLVLQQLARDIGEKRGCQRFLFDMTQAKITGGTMDTFETGTVPVDPDKKQTRQKVALLYDHYRDDHKFLENVAVNRGYQLRVFVERGKALEWLKPMKGGS